MALLLALALSSALTLSPARAATFSVSPLRVELDARHRTDMLTLRNTGDEPLRIQVRSMHWDMAGDGEWQLTPSDDLIVTPQFLEIAPGQSGQLRIGSLTDAGAREASYRLLLDELPNLSEGSGGQSPEIRVLTRVSLPVFLEPAQATRLPALSTAQIEHGALVIGMDDRGTRRLDPQKVTLTLIDRNGRVLEQREQMANYVLPGSTSFLQVKLSANVCQRAASVSVSWLDTQASNAQPITTGAQPITTGAQPITTGAESCEGASP